MRAVVLVVPLSIVCWLASIAIAIGSPFLFEVGVCILGILVCGVMLIAGALTAERVFPMTGEQDDA